MQIVKRLVAVEEYFVIAALLLIGVTFGVMTATGTPIVSSQYHASSSIQ